MLMLVDGQGTTLFTNNDWQDAQAGDTMDRSGPDGPAGSRNSRPTLSPGNYITLLFDAEGAFGVGLLEISNITNSQAWVQR